jgi:cytoskeletal protein CcmA (bactofilin family)
MAKTKNFGTPADADMKINSDITIKGSIEGNGSLWLDGTVYGDINISGNLYVAENAQIHGNATANNISILGFIKGIVKASKTLNIGSVAKLTGDIFVKHLITEDGSTFNGKCHLISTKNQSEAPLVKPINKNIEPQNIKSKANKITNTIPKEEPNLYKNQKQILKEINKGQSSNFKNSKPLKSELDNAETQATIETKKLNQLMKKQGKNKIEKPNVKDFYEVNLDEENIQTKKTGFFNMFKKKDKADKQEKKIKEKKLKKKNVISDNPAEDPVLAQIFNKKEDKNNNI